MGSVQGAASDAEKLVCLCYSTSIPESIEDAILVDKAKMVCSSILPHSETDSVFFYLLHN
jgi:hypothetical protein